MVVTSIENNFKHETQPDYIFLSNLYYVYLLTVHLRLKISNDSNDTDSTSTTANVQYSLAEQKIPLVRVSPLTRCKSKRKKRWRETYATETNFRRVHPFLLQKYSPHFRGQETGPAITHSCICHELNLEIVHTFTDFVSLEQQVSLMNDYWKKAPRGITQA